MLYTLLSYITYKEIVADLILLACLVFAWRMPLFANRLFSVMERLGTLLSHRKGLTVGMIGMVGIVIRLSLLRWLSIPIPEIHDEFSYLLAGDTFAHGHLVNPPHPMSIFFETIHVNQLPTYMSKYPPAQGAVLALGQLLGNPWIGVLLSTAGMSAVALWMLQGWMPPQWALLGGTLVMLRLGIFTYWMNSYWGGAVPAIGGALVVGALPRILHRHRARDAIIMGLGASILASSRPLEGLFLCVPVMVLLIMWAFRRRKTCLRPILLRFFLPFCAVALLAGIFLGYYNWRGTGNPFLFPYVLNQRTYSTTPAFVWQNAGQPRHYLDPQLEDYYNRWNRDYWEYYRVNSFGSAMRHLALLIPRFVYFFLWPELFVPFLSLPWLLRDRRIRFLFAQTGFYFLGTYSVLWFLPHYAAPLMATVFALLTQAIRHLRRWRYNGRPVGIGLSRVVVLFAVLLAPIHERAAILGHPPPDIEYRAAVSAKLNDLPGEHLVIVRYSSEVETGEWVYNAADIGHAKVVWARELTGVSSAPLLNYFKGRKVWLVEPGVLPVELEPYSPPPAPTAEKQ